MTDGDYVPNLDGVWSLLRLALRLVAADADAQIERLIRFGIDSDDLAESVHDSLEMANNLRLLTPPQTRAVSALDELFDRMTAEKNADLWSDEALRNSPQWSEARTLALEALRQLPDGPSAEERLIR